jgi:hypothetical protein
VKCWRPILDLEKKHLELVIGMSTDCLMGNGVDKRSTYTHHLRAVADALDNLGKKHDDETRVNTADRTP